MDEPVRTAPDSIGVVMSIAWHQAYDLVGSVAAHFNEVGNSRDLFEFILQAPLMDDP